jgi:hypothetical protein
MTDVWEVAGAFEELEPTAGHCQMCSVRVLNGDDPVIGSPHDQGWPLVGQVETVIGVDSLAPVIDDGAHRVDERVAWIAIGQC